MSANAKLTDSGPFSPSPKPSAETAALTVIDAFEQAEATLRAHDVRKLPYPRQSRWEARERPVYNLVSGPLANDPRATRNHRKNRAL